MFHSFSDNNISQKIVHTIQKGQIPELLDKLCYIKDNAIILDYVYFKHFAHLQTYQYIMQHITSNIDTILTNYPEFVVHVNMKHLTIGDIDKHKTFIQEISIYLKDKYPQKLTKCYIYNAPYIFSQIYNFVSLFIDKDTQQKIDII